MLSPCHVHLWAFLAYFPFIYNRIYIKKLLKKGFYPADDESKDILVAKKMLAQPEPPN